MQRNKEKNTSERFNRIKIVLFQKWKGVEHIARLGDNREGRRESKRITEFQPRQATKRQGSDKQEMKG